MEFDWDADNVKHIARHGITPKEAEEAVLIEPLEADVQPHESEERVLRFRRAKSWQLLISYIPNGAARSESSRLTR